MIKLDKHIFVWYKKIVSKIILRRSQDMSIERLGWPQDLKKKDKLSWIVRFLQTDLDNLSRGEKKRLAFSSMLLPLFGAHVIKVLSSHKTWEERDEHFFPLPWEGLKHLQDGMNKFFHSLLDQKEGGSGLCLPSTERELTISNDGSYKIEYPSRISAQKIVEVSIFISEFADLLNGLPKDWIRKCPGCEKFFVHLSKKKRLYCSNRCAYKTIYRSRVERLLKNGQYGAYLDKQNKVMKKRYKEKILNGKED
jgi:hypothetical protein